MLLPRLLGALLTRLGAGFLTYWAVVARRIDCGEDQGSVCSTSGLVQLLIALVGLGPAIGMLVQSVRYRGRPGRWFAATLLVYVT